MSEIKVGDRIRFDGGEERTVVAVGERARETGRIFAVHDLGNAWVVEIEFPDNRQRMVAWDPDLKSAPVVGAYATCHPEMHAAQPALDALGKPVPEWAAEAFAILSADGRRVFVDNWPDEPHFTVGDALLIRYSEWPDEEHRFRPGIHVAVDARRAPLIQVNEDTPQAYADLARRALAMEAERKAPKVSRAAACRVLMSPETYGPLGRALAKGHSTLVGSDRAEIEACLKQPTFTINWQPPAFTDDAVGQFAAAVSGLSRAVDSFVAKATDAAKREFPPERLAAENMRGLATCLRCGGPAGFLGIRCERVGGCATAEERVAAMVPRVTTIADHDAMLEAAGGDERLVEYGDIYACEHARTGEPAWSHGLVEHERDGSLDAAWATRDLAIAAWREAMLARERGR